GQYSENITAITVYGLNVICIGVTLLFMRYYIEHNPAIETAPITPTDRRSGYIRIIFPIVSALAAIIIGFWNPTLSLLIFTIAIIFNIVPASTNILHNWIERFFAPDLKAKDLAKMAPRSPYMRLHGFALLPRTIDKCRATIAGTVGEYRFNCPLDKTLFGFKGIEAGPFRDFVACGVSDEEIGKWVNEHGYFKTVEEIKHWSDSLDGQFDGVVEDDRVSFPVFAKKRKIA
ncbi:MAG: DUF5069 domain-containing protein, partial [Candidatus Pacebacteria bacterium]|nr:DUF5069 domain-containing protein [Candidatus Paceibacterota bacterium]